jgi:hypothetical protein
MWRLIFGFVMGISALPLGYLFCAWYVNRQFKKTNYR